MCCNNNVIKHYEAEKVKIFETIMISRIKNQTVEHKERPIVSMSQYQ